MIVLSILIEQFLPQTWVISSLINADQHSAEGLGGVLCRFAEFPLFAALPSSPPSLDFQLCLLSLVRPPGSTWLLSWHHFLDPRVPLFCLSSPRNHCPSLSDVQSCKLLCNVSYLFFLAGFFFWWGVWQIHSLLLHLGWKQKLMALGKKSS